MNTYTYDSARETSPERSAGGNRLIGVSGQSPVSSYQYNGLSDRLSQNYDNMRTYTLDLAGGLPQVLNEGTDTQITDTYIYGQGRIADDYGYSEYYLTDALGSVRQVIDEEGLITLTRSYAPYGEVIDHTGYGYSNFGFTGEMTDDNGLVYLRARYYSPYQGRFMSRDTWGGDVNEPMSYNVWLYGYSSPILNTDPSGQKPLDPPIPPKGMPEEPDEISDSDLNNRPITRQVYEMYKTLYRHTGGWWWQEYGSDNQFSLEDYLDLLLSYEFWGEAGKCLDVDDLIETVARNFYGQVIANSPPTKANLHDATASHLNIAWYIAIRGLMDDGKNKHYTTLDAYQDRPERNKLNFSKGLFNQTYQTGINGPGGLDLPYEWANVQYPNIIKNYDKYLLLITKGALEEGSGRTQVFDLPSDHIGNNMPILLTKNQMDYWESPDPPE